LEEIMNRKIRNSGIAAFLSLALAAALHAADSPASEDAVPRYQLKVGQELTYEGSSDFHYTGGSQKTTDHLTLWMTRQNADGSWHVIGHNENSFRQSFGGNNGGPPEQKQEVFDAFDVFPDGRVAGQPEDFYARRLTAVFPKLPADAAATKAGWETQGDDGGKTLYRLAPQSDPASGKWIFEGTEQGLFNEVYLSTSKATLHFDAGRGLITKIESENTQGYGFNGKGTGVMELKSTTQKDPEWIAQLDREADTFLQAKAAVRNAAISVQHGAKPDDATASAKQALRSGRQKVKLPVVDAQFAAQLEQLSQSSRYMAESAKDEAEVLNKAAAEWETTDINGNKQTLAGYRGKVVVLDFWYRGCGWCIRAMPQIKEVADHFRGQPVAILGMNTDREEKDARFVVDKLQLNYPTLKAEGLPEKYKVQGFPTLVIIDQKGVVRARHVGYSPDLREELIKTIDGLLASAK
jgi:thiol-disulfide isomerase/thioredoxin